jgi:hypothetical protein
VCRFESTQELGVVRRSVKVHRQELVGVQGGVWKYNTQEEVGRHGGVQGLRIRTKLHSHVDAALFDSLDDETDNIFAK